MTTEAKDKTDKPRHKWGPVMRGIAYCEKCGCRRDRRFLTPEYELNGKTFSGETPPCINNQPKP